MSAVSPSDGARPATLVRLESRLAGVLLGTAVGDALGLPMEGMGARAVARVFPVVTRYQLLGRTGFVSDDTEQSALVAQSLARHPGNLAGFLAAFRRSLLGWFLRLPWGIGLGTLKACLRIALGFARSGVASAGNGAAMRAAILGAFFFDAPARRREWSDALAQVTHLDRRAVEGARFVTELTASCVAADSLANRVDRVAACTSAVEEPTLRDSLLRAGLLAEENAPLELAAERLGTTGFVLHSLGIATFCFLRFGDDPEVALSSAIRAGGDTDTNAAILGAWLGALHGEGGLPAGLVEDLGGGPFGRDHLRALARDLAEARQGTSSPRARYSPLLALLRNLALYPVVLAHAFRVLFRRG